MSKRVVDESLFPLRYREMFVALLRRYNTAIAKRNTLTSMNFERFVLLKGNVHLLLVEIP